MSIRILNRDDIRKLISMRECIALMRQAFLLVSEERATQPIRRALMMPHGKGMVGMMPGHIAEPACFGVKVVSVYPGNHGTPYGSHQGAVLLFDDQTGALRAVLDGRDITAVRTGAASAAATDVLARKDARALTIYGYGDEAETHLEAVTLVRDFERILVCGRSTEKAALFAGAMGEKLGRAIDHTSDFEAAADADVICTVTSADEPFLLGRFIREGTHLNVVGSSVPTASEVDDELVRKSRFFTDYTESALELGGELRGAIARGVVGPDHILGCIGDVLTAKVSGRRNDQDITLFKSLGMIAEDLITSAFVMERANARGIGIELTW
jgi:ornithine cyclodeaminase/alanine dehydrogenase-like protein (mu-crystallin family)